MIVQILFNNPLKRRPLQGGLQPRAILLLVLCLLIIGCDEARPPKKSWENAVQGLYTAALSNEGDFAIIGSINHGASLWDMRRGERLFNWNHTKNEYTGIVAAAISPDTNYAATATHRTIVLWELNSGKPIWFWTAPGNILSLALTPNGNFALLGLDNHTAVLFDIKNGGVKRIFHHNGKVRSVTLSQDAKLALTGSDDRSAKLWDLESGEKLHQWTHENQLTTTALSPSGKYAFTAAQADKAVIWNTKNGAPVKEMPIKKGPYIAGSTYTSARFSQDEQQLLTGTNSQLVQLWDIGSGQEMKRWKVTKKDKWKPTSATLLAVSFSRTGGLYYAIASNGLSYELE
ncbi:MAG: PQQ-binding-like beta-propeller repeat protein [Pseudomonadales bacterium]|nr:PQQ-binding-like beta-propeller repeat protein [Pseudomonadales bacterium]